MKLTFLKQEQFRFAGIGVLAACTTIVMLYIAFNTSDAQTLAGNLRKRDYICSKTGKVFHIQLHEGDTIPRLSPYTNELTGYPAERCYWTTDGKTKPEPTYVLLNIYMGIRKPTFCPDCGRLVVPYNPTPEERKSPPPAKDEYRSNFQNDRN
jgi:hypothetical protein